HVGIGVRETLGGVRRIAFEQQHGPVARLGQCAGQDESVRRVRLPGELQMVVAMRAAARKIIGSKLVEQQIVHGRSHGSPATVRQQCYPLRGRIGRHDRAGTMMMLRFTAGASTSPIPRGSGAVDRELLAAHRGYEMHKGYAGTGSVLLL